MNDNPKAPRGQVHQLRIEHIEAYTTQSGRTRWKVTVSGIVVDVPNGMLRDPRRIAVEMGSILHTEGAWRADDRILDLVELVENEPMMDSVAVDLQTEEELDHAIERVVLCLYRLTAIRHANLQDAPKIASAMLARLAK